MRISSEQFVERLAQMPAVPLAPLYTLYGAEPLLTLEAADA